MSRPIRALSGAIIAAGLVAGLAPSAAAEGNIRIVEQFGISYLPFYVIREQRLIEKHGAANGVEISAEWAQVGGGAAANDALLSGSVDVVSAGLGPLLTIWDRTRGSYDVKGIAAGAALPFALVTNNPDVRTIADFTEADRIALPSVTVSVQARTLQYAAAELWGIENFDRLDTLTVSLPHPDATQALLSGSANITAHFSNPPFQDQALADPTIHKVLDSFEIYGGPTTSVTIYTTTRFRDENPKTYRAFLAALDEAAEYIRTDPEGAADTYSRVAGSSLDREIILSILKAPGSSFDPVPLNTEKLANFLHAIGAIKTKPESWRDYFFNDIHARAGS